MESIISYSKYIPYVAGGLIVAYILYIEKKDVQCPTLTSTNQECVNEGGMSFSYTKPSIHDSCDVLFNKVKKAAGAEPNSIKWRRSLILSFSIVAITTILAGPVNVSDANGWKTFYISVMLSFIILLGNYIYYSYHIYGKAESWLKDGLEMIREKCIH